MTAPDPSVLRTGVSVSAREDGCHAVVQLHGDLCPQSAVALRRELEQLVDDGVVEITVELADLRLCTSHGLDVFDQVHHALFARHGGSLCLDLTGAPEIVVRVVQLLRDRDPSFGPRLAGPPAGAATAHGRRTGRAAC